MREGSAHQRDPRLGSAPRPGEEKEEGGGEGGVGNQKQNPTLSWGKTQNKQHEQIKRGQQ